MRILDDELSTIVATAIGGDRLQRIATEQSRETASRPRQFHLRRARDLREMLNGLAAIEFSPRQAPPLQKVCEGGTEYGLRVLGKTLPPELFSLLQPKAKRGIRRDLRLLLVRVTRPCFTLEFNAFRFAHEAIYSQSGFSTPEVIANKFLGERPYDRLISIFKKFPVLAQLWSQLISQWCDSISELLARIDADKQPLSRALFRGQPVGKLVDLRTGLSDPHNRGRTVMRLRFEAGPIIYKPRSGYGEQEWFGFVRYLNAASFRPKLIAAQVLCRDGYCWMQEVLFAPCKDEAAARRFYKRLGAMIATAYLLKAVDCHRDNMVACGEYPVLVDAEAMWHVPNGKKIKTSLRLLDETGFLPRSSRRSSYQYRSSVLAQTAPGNHTPHIGARPLDVRRFEAEIIFGFRRAWRCLLGTVQRRTAFGRRLRRLVRQEWRQIHWSTKDYDAIMRASIQPAALRSGVERNMLLARLCRRNIVNQRVIREEINALRRLDIPHFIRVAAVEPSLPEGDEAPPEIIEALQRAVHL